ncbi:MAG: A24 family peptidase [Oscillospiraceae bacterium]|nr:A24 family peptidase [Oscillospiraceae bacterium]
MTEVLTSAAAAIISAFVFIRYTAADKKESIAGYIKNNDIICARIVLVFLAVNLLVIHISGTCGRTICETANSAVLINAMIVMSVSDIKFRKIPNTYLLELLTVKCIIIAADICLYSHAREVLVQSVTGLAAGFGIMMIIYLVSRKSVGAGDVKMYSVIGFFAGGAGIIDILVYSSVFCTLTGSVLLITRKCTLKSLVPMAPFACLGSVTYFIIGAVK